MCATVAHGLFASSGRYFARSASKAEPVQVELQHVEGVYRAPTGLQIGTPGQRIPALFDTGSFDTLAFSRRCIADCEYQTDPGESFSPDKSESYDGVRSGDLKNKTLQAQTSTQLIELTFGQGSCVCLPAFDRVQVVGEQEQVTAEHSMILEGVWAEPSLGSILDLRVTAVVGLGKTADPDDKLAPARLAPSLLEKLDVDVFSMCYGPGEDAGYLLLNDPFVNPGAPHDGILEARVVGHEHWGVSVKGIEMGGEDIGCGDGCVAIVDSGTTLILLPPRMADRVLKQVEKLGVKSDCSNADLLPNLNFDIEGFSGTFRLSISPQAYMMRLQSQIPGEKVEDAIESALGSSALEQCMPMVAADDTMTEYGPMLILGHPAFTEYVVSFTPKPKPHHSILFQKAHQIPGTSCLDREAKGHAMVRTSDSAEFRRVRRSAIRLPPPGKSLHKKI